MDLHREGEPASAHIITATATLTIPTAAPAFSSSSRGTCHFDGSRSIFPCRSSRNVSTREESGSRTHLHESSSFDHELCHQTLTRLLHKATDSSQNCKEMCSNRLTKRHARGGEGGEDVLCQRVTRSQPQAEAVNVFVSRDFCRH